MSGMNQVFDDYELEQKIIAGFGINLDVDSVIARSFPVGPAAEAYLFLNSKKQLFLYVSARTKTLLSDVQKIVSKVGLKSEKYIPPKNDTEYFNRIGTQKFREVFPGRGNISDQDIAFYRTLAPYSPALVQISEVKNGVVYQFDSDSASGWRPSVKFAYRRISTS